LSKGLGEDYHWLRRGKIDGYLGNPGIKYAAFWIQQGGRAMPANRIAVIFVAAMTASGAGAQATVISDVFTGIVSSVTDTGAIKVGTPKVGDTVSEGLTYDTVLGQVTSIGGLSQPAINIGSFTSQASVTPGFADFKGTFSTLPAPDAFETSFEFQVNGTFPAMSVESFLASPPPFTGGAILFSTEDNFGLFNATYDATLTGIAPAAVPEPGGLLPFAAGLVGLGVLFGRRAVSGRR
jgi:hypothetical protein